MYLKHYKLHTHNGIVHDAAVIGGGPIGLFIAWKLAKRGYDVHVFEEHSEIGNPWHCSGLFSKHIFDITGNFAQLHPARKARIIAPSGEELEIGDEKIHGYVVDRVEFDRTLARQAVRAGAELHLKSKIKNLNGGKVQGKNFRVVVGADGINSVVRRAMGIAAPEMRGAVQAIVPYETEFPDKVTIWVGESVAPGFFAWLIPLNNEMAKVGLASRYHAYDFLQRLLRRIDAEPLAIMGGAIPITQVERTWKDNMVIVGDAAGQVKATSGGGVFPGLMAAKCAIDAISRYIDENVQLKSYETCWRKEIGKELKIATRLHRIYESMSDSEFNSLIHDLNDPKIVEIINRYGDIDYPSRVAWRVFSRRPGLLKYSKIAAKQKKF